MCVDSLTEAKPASVTKYVPSVSRELGSRVGTRGRPQKADIRTQSAFGTRTPHLSP